MPVTDFPAPGDDKQPSLANSQWELFPVSEAEQLRQDWPGIWDEGGNIRGNRQFALLAPMARERRGPRTPAEEQAVRLREAWVARHRGDFRLPGVVAQIKWLAVGERGLEHMRDVINEAKAKQRQERRTMLADLVTVKNGEGEYEGERLPIYTFRITSSAVDRQNEVVDPNGWDFSAYEKNPVILDNHRYESIEDILGRALLPLRRLPDGWEVDILLSSCDKAKTARTLIDEGMLNAVSVGFRSLEREREGTVLVHRKQELLEISLVSIPANPEAIRVRAALPFSDLPLADMGMAWDGSAARQRVQELCGADGADLSGMDWDGYARAFLWVDPEMREQDGGYKLLIADVVDGELVAVPRAIYAAAGALAGARDGVDIPLEDRPGVAALLRQWYDKLDMPAPASVEADGYMMDDEEEPMQTMKAGRVLSKQNAELIRAIREHAMQMVEAVDQLLAQLPGSEDVVPEPEYPAEPEMDGMGKDKPMKAAGLDPVEVMVAERMAAIAATLAAYKG